MFQNKSDKVRPLLKGLTHLSSRTNFSRLLSSAKGERVDAQDEYENAAFQHLYNISK